MATYLQGESGIYKITNIISGKIYIGCTSNIKNRKRGHYHDLRNGKHGNSYLQKAWVKYGEENFQFEVLEECTVADLHSKEHYWVTQLNCLDKSIGYNLKPTDPNGHSIHSEETKQKLRIANKGIKPSLKCYDAGRVYNKSELCKNNLIEARKKLTRVDFNEVNAPKKKQVMNIITGEVYDSLQHASTITNVPKYELSRRILGKRKNNTNLIYL
jgi:group I intron endonuclease